MSLGLAELLPLLATALLAGLLGAGHCFGMCAGIAGGLGAVSTGRGALSAAVAFNGGRVLGYALLGGTLAAVLGAAGQALGVPAWGPLLRTVTALLIGAVGLRLLFDWQGLALIERAGAVLWSRIAPLVRRAAARQDLFGRMALGLAWGLLPCGLVYTLLLTAISTGRFLDGFLTMLAFGLGTLPALLGMTLWAPALAGFLQERATRRLVGSGLVLLAAWSLFVLWGLGGGGPHGHH